MNIKNKFLIVLITVFCIQSKAQNNFNLVISEENTIQSIFDALVNANALNYGYYGAGQDWAMNVNKITLDLVTGKSYNMKLTVDVSFYMDLDILNGIFSSTINRTIALYADIYSRYDELTGEFTLNLRLVDFNINDFPDTIEDLAFIYLVFENLTVMNLIDFYPNIEPLYFKSNYPEMTVTDDAIILSIQLNDEIVVANRSTSDPTGFISGELSIQNVSTPLLTKNNLASPSIVFARLNDEYIATTNNRTIGAETHLTWTNNIDHKLITDEFQLTQQYFTDGLTAWYQEQQTANIATNPAGIEIDFHDPWYYDETTQTQPDNFRPITPGQYQVFLDQQPDQGAHYRLKAPLLTSADGEYYVFNRWVAKDANGAELPSGGIFVNGEDDTTTAVVFTAATATVEAEYYTVTVNGGELEASNGKVYLNTSDYANLDGIWAFDQWTVTSGSATITNINSRRTKVTINADNTVLKVSYVNAITTQGKTVEITAGDTVTVPPGANYTITNTDLAIDVNGGVLNMIGTAENRIVLDIPQGGSPWRGIYLFSGELNMEYVDIGNSEEIDIFGGSVNIENTSFIDNPGQAIYIEGYDAVVTLRDVTISGSPFGIYADGNIGKLVVNNSTLTGTNSPGSIGLFAYRDASNITIEKSSITGFSKGLKLHLNRNVLSSLEIINSTIVAADTGLFIETDFVFDDYDNYWKDTLIIKNNIFSANIPYYSTDSDPIQNNPYDPTRVIGYNDTYSMDGSSFDIFNWVGNNGNISADPLFVDPVNGDYTLQYTSPCIDAGDPGSPPDPDGTRADIGAYYFPQLQGTLSSDTTLTQSTRISGDLTAQNITVSSGATLVVDPGVTVKFNGGKRLRVYGALKAEGTAGSPIRFTSAGTTPGPGDWYGIEFGDSSADEECVIKYADIEYAVNGINCYRANPRIENNTISNSSNYGIYLYYSSPTIKNNNIQYSYWRGIYGYASDPYIENDTLTYNSDGVYFYYSSNPRLYNNTINNNDIGVYSEKSSPKLGPISGSGKGNNVITGNYIGIFAYYYANPFLGSTDSENNRIGGHNSVYGVNGDIGHQNVRAISNSDVDAQWNWWGAFPPPSNRFYTDGTSTIDYSNPLSSDPNGGDQGGTLAFGFASELTRKKTTLAGSPAVRGNKPDTTTAAGLAGYAKDLRLYGKHDQAIRMYKSLIRKFSDTPEAQQALVRVISLYRETKTRGLSGYLNGLINRRGMDERLRTIASDFLIGAYVDEGDISKAVGAAGRIIKRFPGTEHEYTALFELFTIYHNELNDSTKAAETLAVMKRKYPDYRLTMTAQVALGEEVDLSKLRDFGNLRGGKETAAEMEEPLPKEYRLGNNYPNPFNPTTVIPYELPVDSYVSLVIYDLLGREIVKLIDGEMTAGFRQVEWNGKDRFGNQVGSGVYLYRISARGMDSNEPAGQRSFARSGKMVLVR